MSAIKQRRKWVYIIVTLVIWAFVGRTIIPYNIFLKLDLSQEYRNINEIDGVVFRENGQEKYYERCFWGLRKINPPDKFTEWDGRVGVLPEIEKFIKYVDEHDIWVNQAVVSPDRKYILFDEIKFGYRGTGWTGLTDDEYCYYRVFEIDTGEIYTIYGAYQEWYQFDWR